MPEGAELAQPGRHLRVPDDFEVIGRTEEDETRGHHDIRTDVDRVRVVPDRGGRGTVVEFTANVEDTDCEITSCALPLTLLREVGNEETR